MPKPRVVDPAFFDDLDIAKLTRDERLLVVALVVACADDYGRLPADPAYLRKQAFGYDEEITIEAVAIMRANVLQLCRNVRLYVVNGQEYIHLRNWEKFQKIRYKVASKLPAPPPEDIHEIGENLTEDPREITAKVASNSPSVVLSGVEQGSVDKGRVVAEVEVEEDTTATAATCLNLWTQIRNGPVNELDIQELARMAATFGPQAVIAAMREANMSRRGAGVNLKYIGAILGRWKGTATPCS